MKQKKKKKNTRHVSFYFKILKLYLQRVILGHK